MFHKRLLKEFKENQKLVAGMVMTQWITLLANVVLVFALALFVSNLLQGQTQGKLLWILPVTLIAVMLVRGIANTVNQKLSFQASSNVKRRLRELTYEKLMRLGTKYHENIATSEAVQISTEGVDQLEIYFGKYVPQFFLQFIGTTHVICDRWYDEHESSSSAVTVCAVNSNLNRGSTEVCQENAAKILGYLHRAW